MTPNSVESRTYQESRNSIPKHHFVGIMHCVSSHNALFSMANCADLNSSFTRYTLHSLW